MGEHQKWIDSLKIGDMVCDCRYRHSEIVRFTVSGSKDKDLRLDDEFFCSARHCCDPVDHPPHWWVYLLRCKDSTFYIGITLDLDRRLREHNSGGKKAAKYTRGRGPVKLVKTFVADSKSEALRMEASWKKVPKSRKTKWKWIPEKYKENE
jgi:putative endonuclease